MSLVRLGSELGGWTIDLSRVPYIGTVIDAGIGYDISFPEELKKVRPGLDFVFVDPVLDSLQWAKRKGFQFEPLHGAIHSQSGRAKIFGLLQHSDSLNSRNRNVDKRKARWVKTFGLRELVRKYNPVLMKLDLEGAEFDCYEQALGVEQFCMEFHHRNIRGWTDQPTKNAIEFFESKGYVAAHRSEHDQITFVKNMPRKAPSVDSPATSQK